MAVIADFHANRSLVAAVFGDAPNRRLAISHACDFHAACLILDRFNRADRRIQSCPGHVLVGGILRLKHGPGNGGFPCINIGRIAKHMNAPHMLSDFHLDACSAVGSVSRHCIDIGFAAFDTGHNTLRTDRQDVLVRR